MDKFNKIQNDKDYGYPNWACDQFIGENHTNNTEFPLVCFYDDKYANKTNYYTIAPSGGDFVTDPDHPWYGNFFLGSLRGSHIHRFIFDENNNIEKREIFLLGFGRIRDVVFNEHDGSLYAITDNSGAQFEHYDIIKDKLIKLTPI